MSNSQLKNYINSIPDFPKKGVIFRDLAPLMSNPKAWNNVVDEFGKLYIGEAGGFQDYLFGFGMNSAIYSSFLAIKSLTP